MIALNQHQESLYRLKNQDSKIAEAEKNSEIDQSSIVEFYQPKISQKQINNESSDNEFKNFGLIKMVEHTA